MGKSVHIRNRNGRLYIETYIHGKQTRRSLDLRLTGDRKQDRKVLQLAEVIRSQQEMQLACVEWGIPYTADSDKLLTEYIEENYQKSGSYTLGRCLYYIRTYGNGAVRLSGITPQWVESFQLWLKEKTGLSQGTASLYAGVLRHQLRLAVRDKLIRSNPAEFIRNIPMPDSNKQPLTLAQLKRLATIPICGQLGAEVRDAFFFSCYTGLRVSDVKRLRWGMFCRRMDGSTWVRIRQQKTGKNVEIPLHESALALIGGIKSDSCEYVFPRLSATRTNTDQYLLAWGLKAGIEHVSWHTARHTMATLALEQGAEIRTVSELLGHTDISTTLRYAKATDALKKSAIQALPKFLPEP